MIVEVEFDFIMIILTESFIQFILIATFIGTLLPRSVKSKLIAATTAILDYRFGAFALDCAF